MRRKAAIVFFGIMMMTATAQTVPAEIANGSAACELLRVLYMAPYYFCDCKENSNTFAFPLEAEINDTVWYTASADDLKQGISAYWFADCSVTMEVYAFCQSTQPTISMTVGANQMCDVDVTKINQKLEEMGELAQSLSEILTPHLRVYPNGGTGRVYCYPYNQGPHSTCENPLPLRPQMTYVCDQAENVYRLEPSLIAASGKSFIHWKQEKNKACAIWLTMDACEGEEIGRAELTDSLHVYQPDAAQMRKAREENRSIWLHVQHAEGVTGRIYYYNDPKYIAPINVEDSTCLGKTLRLNERTYAADTVFEDTLWVGHDTLQTMYVQFRFSEPELEYDTVYVNQSDLARGYRYQPSGDILYTYGDTIVEIKKTNICTRRIQLTLLSPENIENVSDNKRRAYKQLQDGQLYIILDEQKYNPLGQKINNIINN